LTLASAAFILAVASMAARARKRPLVHGAPSLVGASGELVEFGEGTGWALVQGEHWKVRSGEALAPGTRIRVVRLDGSTLEIAADPRGG
jgi:membrane-bound serine protease (ClpP class)